MIAFLLQAAIFAHFLVYKALKSLILEDFGVFEQALKSY
jgi:hypothetical protein